MDSYCAFTIFLILTISDSILYSFDNLFILCRVYKIYTHIIISNIFYKITFIIKLFQISCAVGRSSSGQNIPLKVKGKWFHYVLDKQGEIYNPKLFDLTAGLRRNV